MELPKIYGMDDTVKISRATWNYMQKQNELMEDRIDCLEELASAYWRALLGIIKRLSSTTGDDLTALLLITPQNKLVPLPFSVSTDSAPGLWKFTFDKSLTESEHIALIRKIMARAEFKKRKEIFLIEKAKKESERKERENARQLGIRS